MTSKSNAVVAAQTGKAMLAELGDLQNEFSSAVQVRAELIKIPQLKLDNALSDSVKGKLSEPGFFSCFVQGISFGPTVTIIPLIITESASYLQKKTSELICSSKDLLRNREGKLCKQCPHGEYWADWGTKTNPKVPECKNSIDMIVIVNPFGDTFDKLTVMQLSLRKSNHKAGRNLVNLIGGDPRRIPFGRMYELTSKEEKSNNNDYWGINPNKIKATELTDEQLAQVIPVAREMLRLKNSGKIQTETVADDMPSSDEEGDNVPF